MRALTNSYFPDKSVFKGLPIHEGTEVFFTGLFTGFIGEKRIYPIVRFGKIALISEEKIDFAGQKRELLLLESSSYGGNSGSPVYASLIHPDGRKSLTLAGILNGSFREISSTIDLSGNAVPLATAYNNGISGVTPIYLLNEILYQSELSTLRK